MIALTKLNREEILLNSDLIEHVEETPDTVIVLVTKQAFRVLESKDEIRRRVIEFRRETAAPARIEALIRDSKGPHQSYGSRDEQDETD
jgi:flagellar protein FlbD